MPMFEEFMFTNRLLRLTLFLLVTVGGGLLNVPDSRYSGLAKPFFNLPNWIFGPVWTVLYVLIAIAGWRVTRSRWDNWPARVSGRRNLYSTFSGHRHSFRCVKSASRLASSASCSWPSLVSSRALSRATASQRHSSYSMRRGSVSSMRAVVVPCAPCAESSADKVASVRRHRMLHDTMSRLTLRSGRRLPARRTFSPLLGGGGPPSGGLTLPARMGGSPH
jgi:hypothetical protein